MRLVLLTRILYFKPVGFEFVLRFAGFPCLLENPGKSWIFISKILRTRKVLENQFGAGKSLNLLVVQINCWNWKTVFCTEHHVYINVQSIPATLLTKKFL